MIGIGASGALIFQLVYQPPPAHGQPWQIRVFFPLNGSILVRLVLSERIIIEQLEIQVLQS